MITLRSLLARHRSAEQRARLLVAAGVLPEKRVRAAVIKLRGSRS